VSAKGLDFSLLRPLEGASFDDLVSAWRYDEIEILLAGLAAFSQCTSLLNKVRGAFGNVLLASASKGTLQRTGCDRHHTCAAEVFCGSRPMIWIGDQESQISKPYVLEQEERGEDLVIRMRVFGKARFWTSAAAEALIPALCHGVHWAALARDIKRKGPIAIIVDDVMLLRDVKLPAPERNVEKLQISYLSPFDQGRPSGSDLSGLPRRLTLLAPWHGIGVDCFEELKLVITEAVIDDKIESSAPHAAFGGHRRRTKLMLPPSILFGYPQDRLQMMLAMAVNSHIGRGSTIGMGQIAINWIK
jgi:hypothetical protein